MQRMGRDSNPRYSCPYCSFQDCRLSPLGHSSDALFIAFPPRSIRRPIGPRWKIRYAIVIPHINARNVTRPGLRLGPGSLIFLASRPGWKKDTGQAKTQVGVPVRWAVVAPVRRPAVRVVVPNCRHGAPGTSPRKAPAGRLAYPMNSH